MTILAGGRTTFELDKTAKRQASKVLKQLGVTLRNIMPDLLHDVGTFWHHQIMPEHFTPGAETRYGYAQRSPWYMKHTKKSRGIGQGKYVANLLTGRTVRAMSSLYEIKSSQKMATILMQAPDYFRKPFTGTVRRADGSTYTISRQPDKVAEVTRVNANDIGRIQKFASGRLGQMIASSLAKAA